MKEILTKLGNDHLTISFINVKDFSKVYGLYTHQGEVFCLKAGDDLSWDELDDDEQKEVLIHFRNGDYITDPTLQ